MKISLISLTIFIVACSDHLMADGPYTPVRGISALIYVEKDLNQFVKGYYPTSTCNNFHEGILFEHATGLFVEEAIAKVPGETKAPRTVTRGPLKGGVWCDIQFKYINEDDEASQITQ